jgi:hypothetical protein
MMVHDLAQKALLAARLAEIRAQVQEFSHCPENADIRRQLSETAAILECAINVLAKRSRH